MCDTEVYTVRVDSVFASSNTSFVGYINIPIRNVIKSELLSASICGNAATLTTTALYVHIEELKSKFLDRTDLQYQLSVSGQTSSIGPAPSSTISNVGQLASALVAIPLTDGETASSTIFTVGNYFPVEIPYYEPIRQVSALTVNIYAQDGSQPVITAGPTFLTLRLTCAKPNVCLYQKQ